MVLKRKMFNPLFSSSLYRQNNEARVGKAGVMVRSHLEAEAGSLEREARGVASLSTQGRAPGFALRSAPVPPFTREMLHRVGGRWGEGTNSLEGVVGKKNSPRGTSNYHTY